MTTKPKTGIRQYVSENFWVIVVDIAGALLLMSLLATAAGAPALKEWMFALLTAVPVMAVINIVTQHRKPAPEAVVMPRRPVAERKIYITPRPYDQRVSQAA